MNNKIVYLVTGSKRIFNNLLGLLLLVIGSQAVAQTWQKVGTLDFSAGGTQYVDIAVSRNGTPYVVYRDDGNDGKATVMKYNGVGWHAVGAEGFTTSEVFFTSIAIDTAGIPYVTYKEHYTVGGKINVMKYDGSAWVYVGAPGISDGEVSYTSIKIDNNNTPYIAFEDCGSASFGPATVMKYNGSNWELVGAKGFSAGYAEFISLAINNSGSVYVTYMNYDKLVVKNFKGSFWSDVTSSELSEIKNPAKIAFGRTASHILHSKKMLRIARVFLI